MTEKTEEEKRGGEVAPAPSLKRGFVRRILHEKIPESDNSG